MKRIVKYVKWALDPIASMMLAAVLVLSITLGFVVSAHAQNKGGTVFASEARTDTTRNSQDFINQKGRSAIITIDITARTSGTNTYTVQGKDGTSGKYFTVLASTALNSTGTTVLRVGPSLTAAGNTIANDNMPMVWRVSVAGAATPIMTYSVGYMILD